METCSEVLWQASCDRDALMMSCDNLYWVKVESIGLSRCGIIRRISTESSSLSPAVSEMVAGTGLDVARTALPFSQCHVTRNQKHFCRFIAPPVLKSNHSHCCARVSSELVKCEMDLRMYCMPGGVTSRVYPRPASSTNASPLLLTVSDLWTDRKTIEGMAVESDFTINRKHISQSSGPMLDPCPGPNRK